MMILQDSLLILTLMISVYFLQMSCQFGGKRNAKQYLQKYGYLKRSSLYGRRTGSGIKDEVTRFQYFANIPTTGRLDSATLKQMEIPRCGMKDPKINLYGRRYQRYILHNSKWNKTLLTWKLDNTGRTMSKYSIIRVLTIAFSKWAEHANINFKRIFSGTPDIEIRFVTGLHDGPYSFDGKGGTLAHAFFPRDGKGIAGDIHFDNDEDFSYKSKYGHSLLWVATHEIGHSLGLEHSSEKASLMYPWHENNIKKVQLSDNDIAAIKSIYGEKVAMPLRNIPCPSGDITAMYFSLRARLFVAFTTTGQVFLIRLSNGIKYGPISIKDMFKSSETPTTVDAAFYIETSIGEDKTILFSGENYFIYHEFTLYSGPHNIHGVDGNHPKPGHASGPHKGPHAGPGPKPKPKKDLNDMNPLNLQFPAWVKRIDAVMKWKRNKRIYFFSSQYYWRYSVNMMEFDYGYPKLTQDMWKGLPKSISAAYSGRGPTFIISGKQIFYLSDWGVNVPDNYPQHVACKFLDCGGNSFLNECNNVKNYMPLHYGPVARDP